MIGPFVVCPLCAHSEKLSQGATSMLREAIDDYLDARLRGAIDPAEHEGLAELTNIRNHIVNAAQRAPTKTIDHLLD